MAKVTENHQCPVVLVVDDDDTARLWAQTSLGQAGFDVVEAADGLEALDVLQERRPDIILLDVEMPKLDGFGTCTRVRALPQFETVPILMVTGLDDTTSIDRAYAAGATDFATKPINWSILSHRLRYMLRSSEVVHKLATSQATLTNAQRIARLGNWEWELESNTMSWSDEVYRIIGLEPGAATPSVDTFLERVTSDQRDRIRTWFANASKTGQPANLTHLIFLPDGSERSVHHEAETIVDTAGKTTHLQGTLQDITERQRAEDKIHQLAYFDSLTSLPNRESFKERLRQKVARATHHANPFATLFIDLDDFKRINDTLGHAVGDLLLKAVAERLVGGVRTSDAVTRFADGHGEELVARLGGDEFTILVSDLQNSEDAAAVARRILAMLSKPFTLAGHEVFITPSIGIAVFPQDGEDAETLLKNADTAMYSAKRAGKNLYQFYDVSMNATALKRLTLDTHLRKALDQGEFVLHYQPQMDLVNGSIDAVEALLRWHNPELGMVSPAEFIPLAEENGLIIPIGEWVLRTACAQAKAWREDGLPLSRVAVNISALQFAQTDFIALIAQILQDTGLEPNGLELEITETLLAMDVERTVHTLSVLKDMGLQLSIDDFGTGYSSLSYLKRFPIDRLKIDQSFVRDIVSDPDDAAIAMAVIGLASSMNLGVVAEGVETEAQLQFLKDKRCHEVQGYYLSRPLPPDELVSLLRQQGGLPLGQRNEASTQQTVLLVDHDTNMMKAVTKVLEAESYRILTATNAREGLDLLALHDVGVVLSDYLMPGINGTDFLERVRRLFPQTIRIMLSGQTEMKSLIDAVNAGAIYKFLEKPVQTKLLQDTLREAFSVHEALALDSVE